MLTDRISTFKLTPPVVVESGTSVASALDEIQRNSVGCILVVEAGKLRGILTERDFLLKVVARDVDYKLAVDKYMTPDPVTLTPEDSIGDAVNVMVEHKFRHVPILESGTGKPLAVFSIKDVINLVAESFPAQVLNLPPRPHQKMSTPEGA
ncbi:MAG: CBS domain-containing protein [Dehalococcoidia bacterium]